MTTTDMPGELSRQWDVVCDVVRRCTGLYFDQYTERLADNLDRNSRVCVMAVDSGSVFWLRSLLAGRFRKAIGVRLYGTAGPVVRQLLKNSRRSIGAYVLLN